jgi:hypothetical protein
MRFFAAVGVMRLLELVFPRAQAAGLPLIGLHAMNFPGLARPPAWFTLTCAALLASCSGGSGSLPGTPPPPAAYTVGGAVTGLTGSGLVLRDNGGDNLGVSSDGSFAFPTALASGGAYSVTVSVQPAGPSQTCNVSNGSGAIGTSNVSNVAVSCTTNAYAIGGTISGPLGLGLVLQDNGTDNLAVAANSTSFTFATPVASGATYSVNVKTQPFSPAQTCTVGSGTGSVGAAAVTSANVTCTTSSYNVGGSISGLTGSGLVLEDNGGDDLNIAANATSFLFATRVASGMPFVVTVKTQPTSPAETCTVSGTASGTIGGADANGAVVTCTPVTAFNCGTENGTVVTHAANIAANETWAGAGTVHLVPNQISILAPATLTIQPCAIVKLKAGVKIVVSGDLSGAIAKLLVAGDDPATGRVFFETADANQFWGSLVGVNKNSLIELNYAVILDGGNNGGAARNAAIAMTGNSTLPDPVLKINYVAIGDIEGAGIYLNNAAFTADSSELGIVGSPDYPIALSAMALGSIPTYTGTSNAHDEALVVNNANILDNLTIHNRLPIHFKTDGVRVAGLAPTFVPNLTLTLDAGVVLKFERASTAPPMVIFGTNGQANDENAALVANGTAEQPVIFTSAAATPAPGDWAGIWLLTSNGSQLNHVIIEYAGGDAGVGPVNCGPFDPSVNHQAAHTAALLVGDGTDLQYVPPPGLVTNSTFVNNAGNFAIDSVWEASGFGPALNATNAFGPGPKFCTQSKNLKTNSCSVNGVDQSGCLVP